MIHRLSNVELGISGNGNFSWNGDLGVTIAEKTLTGEIPELYDELVFSAQGGVGWKKDWFSINLLGDYVYDRQKENNVVKTDKNIVTSDLQLGVSLAIFLANEPNRPKDNKFPPHFSFRFFKICKIIFT